MRSEKLRSKGEKETQSSQEEVAHGALPCFFDLRSDLIAADKLDLLCRALYSAKVLSQEMQFPFTKMACIVANCE